MRTPEFWYPVHGRSSGPLPWLLAPFAMCYMFAGYARRVLTRPFRAPVAVVCVGNLTAGGTGKTPLALALAERLVARGVKPHFLTRGYGGALAGPVQVDLRRHSAGDVGDESLLLARVAPTWVARNRKAGAIAACAAGAQMILLDDGHQNPQLFKDLSLVLIDAERGFGNGWVMPSGPLREPVQHGLSRADAALLIGGGSPDFPRMPLDPHPHPSPQGGGALPASSDLPPPPGGEGRGGGLENDPELAHILALARDAYGMRIFYAHKRLRDPDALRGKNIHAFCGIGAPQQFFEMLRSAGAMLAETQAFPDHHPFTDQQISAILARAENDGTLAVTTEKDWVRLPPAVRQRIIAIGMEMVFADEAELAQLLDKVLHRQA